MRIGLLGAARISPAAVIEPADELEGAQLQAIAARSIDSAQHFARTHGIAQVLPDYAALVTASNIDLVYNPLPIHLHAQWSINALSAGKHVLCEKPFAMNIDEAREMLAVAADHGVRIIEAFHYRYHPMFQTLLEWLAGNRIGRVRHIRATFNAGVADNPAEIRRRVDTGGGAMMDLGCYPLHWALTVAGSPIKDVSARAALTASGVDEAMIVDLRFDSRVTAHLACSMQEDADFSADLHIEGSHGEIHFSNPLAPHSGGELTLNANDSQLRAELDPRTTYFFQLKAVLSALATGAPLPTEGKAILRQQQALDAVYDAAQLGHLRRLA